MNSRLLLGGLLLAVSTTLFAQPTGASDGKGVPPEARNAPRSCAQAPDPAKCEAHRKELKEHVSQAREACKGKDGPERGACMSTQMCAKAPDPAKCMARAKEHAERRHEMREKHGAPDKKS